MATLDSSTYPNLYRRRALNESETEPRPEVADAIESPHVEPLACSVYVDFAPEFEQEFGIFEDSRNGYPEEDVAGGMTDFGFHETVASEQDIVLDDRREQADDDAMLAGFWRPHKLY